MQLADGVDARPHPVQKLADFGVTERLAPLFSQRPPAFAPCFPEGSGCGHAMVGLGDEVGGGHWVWGCMLALGEDGIHG